MATQFNKEYLKTPVKKETADRRWEFPLQRKNFYIIGIGILTVLLGYALMSTSITESPAAPGTTWDNFMAVTLAPIMLVLGYCAIIPYGLLKFFGESKENAAE